jgi:hypothetical protein
MHVISVMVSVSYANPRRRRDADHLLVAVLLTVFRKTRMREETEVKRALVAKQICEAQHGPAHEEFVRMIERGEIEQ